MRTEVYLLAFCAQRELVWLFAVFVREPLCLRPGRTLVKSLLCSNWCTYAPSGFGGKGGLCVLPFAASLGKEKGTR